MPGDHASAAQRTHRLPRREFIGLAGAGALGLAGCRLLAQGQTTPPPLPRKPNIVVILADDLGYADLGVQGCRDVPTPNIDSIATAGVRFTDGHVSCPLCSPTRAGLMTGRYQQRFGHEFNPGPVNIAAENFGLPLSQITIANMLKDAGYATGMFGKSHLGYTEQFNPIHRGFDEFFGFLGGAHSYVYGSRDAANPILRGTEPVDEKEYLTFAFAREAASFINRHREEPFFVYLPFNAVHMPQDTLPDYDARFAHIVDTVRRRLAAVLSAMDDAVGTVLRALEATGHRNNTLVFFLSDNGGATPSNGSRNTPLRGYKAQMYEGGHRIPFLLQWPDRVPAGQTCDKMAISLDIFATAAAAGGGTMPTDRVMDGVDLVPYLQAGNTGVPHDMLYWRMGESGGIRRANWKIVRPRRQGEELYDLANDIGEERDLAAAEPQVLQELTDALDRWESELVEPLWGKPVFPRRQQRGGVRRRRNRALQL
jgi:arylsulfatase A-like enzyme